MTPESDFSYKRHWLTWRDCIGTRGDHVCDPIEAAAGNYWERVSFSTHVPQANMQPLWVLLTYSQWLGS
jgi:hypothetical protein